MTTEWRLRTPNESDEGIPAGVVRLLPIVPRSAFVRYLTLFLLFIGLFVVFGAATAILVNLLEGVVPDFFLMFAATLSILGPSLSIHYLFRAEGEHWHARWIELSDSGIRYAISASKHSAPFLERQIDNGPFVTLEVREAVARVHTAEGRKIVLSRYYRDAKGSLYSLRLKSSRLASHLIPELPRIKRFLPGSWQVVV